MWVLSAEGSEVMNPKEKGRLRGGRSEISISCTISLSLFVVRV